MFIEKQKYINESYKLDLQDQTNCHIIAVNNVYDKFQYVGTYHIWEHGFETGDASNNDILEDAKNMNIDSRIRISCLRITKIFVVLKEEIPKKNNMEGLKC